MLIALGLSVCMPTQTVLAESAAKAAEISASFLSSEEGHDYFVMVSKQMEMLEKFEEGKTMYDMAEYSVDAKAKSAGTTLVLTTVKSNEYMIFGTSDVFLAALYKSGGRSVRYNSKELSVEFALTNAEHTTNYTRMMVATMRPRGTIGEAWHISSYSGDKSEPFTLRIKLPKAYKASELKLMTYTSEGKTAQVKANLSVVKSGSNYFAKAVGLRSGTYAVVIAS